MDEYGTDNILEDCPYSKCKNPAVDAQWGKWGNYAPCDMGANKCDWGIQRRTRRCDNPVAKNGGKDCVGENQQLNVCRFKKCNPSVFDDDFKTPGSLKNGLWRSQHWIARQNNNNNPNTGPTGAYSGSYYAVFQGYNSGANQYSDLISPLMWKHTKVKKCLILHYQLNGEHVHPDNALAIGTVQDGTNSFRLLPGTTLGGHQGNYWKRMAVEINPMHHDYRVHIRGTMGYSKDADVAVDLITYDAYGCPGMIRRSPVMGPSCVDKHASCSTWAASGECTKNTLWMVAECCKSCMNPPDTVPVTQAPKCENKHASCVTWACAGECVANPTYMKPNCCKACKEMNCPCSANKWSKTGDCDRWAKAGECAKNAGWMKQNCCKSCNQYGG